MNIPPKDTSLHIFDQGMDSDTAPERMSPQRARFMLNVRPSSNGQKGVITNVAGNILVTTPLPAGVNSAHGWGADEETNKFYFIVYNSTGYHTVYMYDALLNNVTIVLQSRTDSNNVDILTLDKDHLINHVDIVQNNLLYFVDGFNKARKFNIKKALDKSVAGYGLIIFQDFVNAYKIAPIYAPLCSYLTDTLRNSNFLYGKLFKFCTRFIYDDGEKSNWSDWSLVPLPPNQSFTGLNSITYDNNCIVLNIETGSQIVVRIEIAMKAGSLEFVSVCTLDKATLAIPDNSQYTYKFYNDGANTATDQEKIFRQFSVLPDKPYLQAFVKNAMTYGNFYEGFDPVNIDISVSVSYADLFLPDGTAPALNDPSFICTQVSDSFSSGSLGINFRHNIVTHFEIGFDVKKGNKFELFGQNGDTDNYYWAYEATSSDTATTIANKVKSWVRSIGRGIPDGPNGVSGEGVDGSGNVYFDYSYLGKWKEAAIVFKGYVNPVNYSTLLDNGLSIPLIKPGSTRKYALAYIDDDGRASLANTSDAAVIRTGFITETGELKKATHRLSISNQPPVWARYYQLLRTPDSGAYIEMLIQKVISVNPDPTTGGNAQKYLDLVVGSLFTYQKLHPNTVLVYDFAKGDRLLLIKSYDPDTLVGTLYPYFETEVLSYSINTEELVNQNIQLDGTATIVIDGVANVSYVGKYIRYNSIERLITGTGAANEYLVDKPAGEGTLSDPVAHASFTIVDRRGILRIKRPATVTVNDLSLVEIYKPQVNLLTGYKDFFPFGEKFEIAYYGTDERAHRGNVQDQYVSGPSSPAIIDVTDGDAFERNRELPINNSVPGTQIIIDHVIDPNFSDSYESDLKNMGRVFPQDDGSGKKYFGSRIRYSNNYIEDTRINGLSDFDNADREDYNDPFGAIMLIRFRENKLFAFKYLKTGWIPILQSIIVDNSGQQLIGTSSKLLNQMQYYSWQGGIGDNPESYVSNGNYQYFASKNSGAFIRVAGDGCDPISSIYNFDKKAREILTLAAKYNLRIHGGFDREHKEVIWSIPDYKKYLYNSGFNVQGWNTYNDAIPAGTVFAIVAQPAHSTVTIDGVDDNGHPLFKIDAGTVLGDDFFTYRGTLSGGGLLPIRKQCFTVTEPKNRQITYLPKAGTEYCLIEYGNDEITQNFTKQGCPEHYHGSVVPYTVDADTYFASTQIAADALAQAEIDANGQTNANTTGTCISDTEFFNVRKSGIFTKAGCPIGYTGSPVEYVVDAGVYSSYISQEDADDKAQDDIDANGQGYANTNGYCIDNTSVNILTVDIFGDATIDCIAYCDTPATARYQDFVNRDGNNFLDPLDAPSVAFALASDRIEQTPLKLRFEFNVGKYVAYDPSVLSLDFVIQGRSATAGTITGSYVLKNPEQGRMTMQGSPGTYIPSVDNPSYDGIVGYSTSIGSGANGTMNLATGVVFIRLTYDVVAKTVTFATT